MDTKTKTFTANKIQAQIFKYLSGNPDKSENDVREMLYEALGINYRQLLRLLTNKRQPDLTEAAKIADTLSCTVDDLIR